MAAAQLPPERVALRARRVFDGTAMLEEPVVLVENGAIVAAGHRPPPSIETIDLGEVTLLPGLIDCHQHLVFDGIGTLEEQVAGVDDEALHDRARLAATSALAAGVTTLRDLGDRSFVTLSLRGDDSLPTILAAGPPLTRVGGHCSYLGGECSGVGELIAAVRDRAERKCDVVKIMVTGGVLTPAFPVWETQFSDDEVRAVVDEAHRLGLPVAAHCHGGGGIRQALDAGADSIEHCTFVTSSGKSEPEEDLLQRLADSDVAVSASLGRVPGEPIPPMLERNLPVLEAMLGRLHTSGATVVVGTDAGIAPSKPHDVLAFALNDLTACGWSALEALATVTRVAAEVCGVADRVGRLAPGLDADLLAVHGDPVSDPGALRAVAGVWKRGRRIV